MQLVLTREIRVHILGAGVSPRSNGIQATGALSILGRTYNKGDCKEVYLRRSDMPKAQLLSGVARSRADIDFVVQQ